ncbi:MAG TPA: hypothetical protein VGW74_17315, partial [Propionibacteriaceae bacterium]|nr:hypothetical protein [Propionibacteriaceae bacterium]
MQSERGQLVWPVPPEREPSRGTVRPPAVETPVLLPPDILLRYGARLLDPGHALQPGSDRRARDNRDRNPDDLGRAIAYGTTAYVADEILASAVDQPTADLPGVADRLTGILDRKAGRLRSATRIVANAGDLDRARDR